MPQIFYLFSPYSWYAGPSYKYFYYYYYCVLFSVTAYCSGFIVLFEVVPVFTEDKPRYKSQIV